LSGWDDGSVPDGDLPIHHLTVFGAIQRTLSSAYASLTSFFTSPPSPEAPAPANATEEEAVVEAGLSDAGTAAAGVARPAAGEGEL
jgi:hypothetical protein